jgi:hypothetical protein
MQNIGAGGFVPPMMGMPNPLAMMMGGGMSGGTSPDQMMMMPHLENIQQMDKTQLDGLLMTLLQMVGPEIATQITPQAAGKGGQRGNQGFNY